MSTTTIRIDEELKARIAAAAERSGKTPHGFILEAISSTVDAAEAEAEFHDLADRRWANILATGKTASLAELDAHLAARAAKMSDPAAKARKQRR